MAGISQAKPRGDDHLIRRDLAAASLRAAVVEIASATTHRINQPLAAIVNYVEAGARELRAGRLDRETVAGDLEQIGDQAVRAAEIVRRLRDAVRPEPEPREVVSVDDLVGEAVGSVAADARDGAVELRVDVATGLPAVHGSRLELVLVLANLLANAIDATAATAPAGRAVTVTATRAGDGLVRTTVADNGSGVEPDVADRLFEPFVSTRAGRLGLGLPIARRIAEAHGGRVEMTAGPNGGMIFEMALPVSEGDDDG
jgi:two-component system sensor kinase FixL